MIRIFVTGGSGLVGRNLTDALSNTGYAYSAPSSTEVDLLNEKSLHTALKDIRPDIIIHCAGTVGGIAANIAEPYNFCDQNTQMALNLIRVSLAFGIKNLINLGSSCMYPREAANPLREDLILSGPLEPTNEGYALSKILSLRLCAYASRQFDVQYKTVIPCNLYGRHDEFRPERAHMIPAAIRKVHEAISNGHRDVSIWGDGSARREFMYAGDLADFLLYAIDNFNSLPPVMNVGVGTDHTVNQFYDIIGRVLGFQGRFTHDTSKPSGMRQKLVDTSKQNELGWSPKTSLPEGVRMTYRYMKEVI